jgi:hypothetical protein
MNQKRVFVFLFVSLMLFSLIAGVVSAQIGPPAPPTTDWGIFEPIRKMAFGWASGEGYSFGAAKFFILIIIWILIGGVLDKFPGLSGNQTGKKYMRFFLSFAIAFLASAYFTATEVALIVSSYSAMGFVLGGIVPFLIMVFFTTSTVSSIDKNKGSVVVQTWVLRGLWTVFGVYYLYRIFSIGGASASDFIVYGHWIFVALSVLVVAFLPLFIKKALKAQDESFMVAATTDAELRANLRAEKMEKIAAIKREMERSVVRRKG